MEILKRNFTWLFAAVMALCISVVAVWYGSLNQDEGWYLYAAQMVCEGKFPYRDFFYTQGPAMPFVYSALAPLWGMSSPLHGLLGGRIATLALGLLSTLCAVGLVRKLVPPERRSLAGFSVFALLACNLYHTYFTTIPKTYALGSLFLMGGLFMITTALAYAGRAACAVRIIMLFLGGMFLAFATGTRISLLLILPVAGFVLLFNFKKFRFSFLWYGLGGMLGLFLTYGIFAIDAASLNGLLAAQKYHADRGGFDVFFVIGSVSRLARGYAALGVILFAWLTLKLTGNELKAIGDRALDIDDNTNHLSPVSWILGLGFAAVFCLQLSAPFPYDDYQVPIMGMLTVLIVSAFARSAMREAPAMWFVVLVTGLVSFTSPMLQEWATNSQDRFWSRKKEMTELAKLREIAREINMIDPEGKSIFTQDLYLAIETGRKVPHGMEMGPFCYFPDLATDKAKSVNVLNRELMTKLAESNDCPVAACSGYAFSIAVPKCTEVDLDEQLRYFSLLKKNFELIDSEPDFGQNSTRLLIMKRKKSGGVTK